MATINILGTAKPGTAITKNATDGVQLNVSSANGAFVVNNLLQAADSSGSVKSLSSTSSAALVTNSSGTPTYTSSLSDGQIVIGSTSGTPAAANLTAGSGISITNAANSVTIAATGGGSGTVNSGTANQLGYYAANGTAISGLNTGASAILIGDENGVPQFTGGMGNGQLLIGSLFAKPVLGNLTAGTGISIVNGQGTITISSTTGGSGTVNSSVAGRIAYYAATGNTVSGLTSAANALLNTDALGNPQMTSSIFFDLFINNVRVGIGAGTNNSSNTAVGYNALNNNTTGTLVTAVGYLSGAAHTNGNNNTFMGYGTGNTITSGSSNTFIGSQTGKDLPQAAANNTFVGAKVGVSGSVAASVSNTFVGTEVCYQGTNSFNLNTAVGYQALPVLNNSSQNVALGDQTGTFLTGSYNTLIGSQSGSTGTILQTGSNNTLLGCYTQVNTISCSNAIAIGYNSIAIASTGATNITYGPGISFGAVATPVGFRGDGATISGGTGRGYWRPNINGTPYLLPLFIDNTITQRAAMVTDTNGSPILSSSMSNGQIIIGSSTGTPAAANITQGTYVTVTNAANSVTINTIGPVITTTNVTGTSQAALVNVRYICQNAAATTITLPATCALGDVVIICGAGGAPWIAQANTGQQIKFSTSSSSVGGTMSGNHPNDACTLTCTTANTEWIVESYSSDAKFNTFT